MSACSCQTITLPSSLYMEARVIFLHCKLDHICCPIAQNMAQCLYLGLRAYIRLSSLIWYHSPHTIASATLSFQLFLQIHQAFSGFRTFLPAISFTFHWIFLQIQSFTSFRCLIKCTPEKLFLIALLYNATLLRYLIFFFFLYFLVLFLQRKYLFFVSILIVCPSCKKSSFVFFMASSPVPGTMPNA